MTPETIRAPFDTGRLDAGMHARGIDVLIASSPHNVRYLLGGYANSFYRVEDAIALSRYQPLVAYWAGGEACFVGSWMDRDPVSLEDLWVSRTILEASSGAEASDLLARELVDGGADRATIAIEAPFLSLEVHGVLTGRLPDARIVDGVELLEHLRAVKRPDELEKMRIASERVVEAMEATFAAVTAGDTSAEVVSRLAAEQRARGLEHAFCNIGFGTNLNRTPSSNVLADGDTITLDSGATLDGYIGDVARMGILGEPTAAQERALAEIDAVQMAAREPIRAGAWGASIYDAANTALAGASIGDRLDFIAHGIGLVSHEAPRLADPRENPHEYPASHRESALEEGMVVSIETTLSDPTLGFLKLEDTVAVTADGCVGFGDGARGWTRAGLTGGAR